MSDWKARAAKAVALSAFCAEASLRFASLLLTKLADAVRLYARA